MQRELYMDISKEDAGGSLYRIVNDDGSSYFYYNHSEYNSKTDEIKVFETNYPDFASFWTMITADKEWYYMHPLFVHPEQRAYIRGLLQHVNWNVSSNKKWQDSHRRQWTKVLTDPGTYYDGPGDKKTT